MLPVMLCPAGVNNRQLRRNNSLNQLDAAPGSYKGVAGRTFQGFNFFWDHPPQHAAAVTNGMVSRGPLTMVISVGSFDIRPVKFAEIQDGLSNTLLVGEYESSTINNNNIRGYWGVAYSFNSLSSAQLESFTRIPDYETCVSTAIAATGTQGFPMCQRAFASLHTGNMINFVMCDGSVQGIAPTIDGNIMRALATIAGGEVIPNY
jgi:prepilin-type processing-associated H-X9-DG protein